MDRGNRMHDLNDSEDSEASENFKVPESHEEALRTYRARTVALVLFQRSSSLAHQVK